MMPIDWHETEMTKIEPEKAAVIFGEVNPHFEPIPMSEETTVLRSRSLPFYADMKLYAFTDYSTVPPVTKYALYRPGEVHVINWTNGPIYDVNECAPVQLTKENVADYARFFFSMVRGQHGRFRVVEQMNDVPFLEDPSDEISGNIAEMIHPIFHEAPDGKSAFVLNATFLFQDALFSSKVGVNKDGSINLYDETLLLEDLPARADIILR
ncbi:MAG: hypothetical protein U9N14_04305 [Pseudomonadota bacterium]|nr:hypothetical protein [Pseudomonadota bacterium]